MQVALARHTPSSGLSTEVVKEAPSKKSRVEIEKCKVPTFSGNTIDYPEFKKSWQKVAGAYWDDDSQLEQMKFKVDHYTKLIHALGQFGNALDKEYGQERDCERSELRVKSIEIRIMLYLPVHCESLELPSKS